MILNDNLIYIMKDNSQYLSFKKLNELGIKNAFSLKSLNFRNRPEVDDEYRLLLKDLEIDYRCLVKPAANHTNNILIVDKKVNEDTADIHLDYLDDIDGVITNKKNIALATTSADCLCIVLYDPVKKVIANIHSGWRGTFKKIAQKGLIQMKNTFGCNPKDILVFLMPAIRQCHFEVDIDVMQECKKIFDYTGRIDEIIVQGRKVGDLQKYNIDTILINKLILMEEGIIEKNIYDSELCTVCNSDTMHSRRADGENFGISTTIVMME